MIHVAKLRAGTLGNARLKERTGRACVRTHYYDVLARGGRMKDDTGNLPSGIAELFTSRLCNLNAPGMEFLCLISRAGGRG